MEPTYYKFDLENLCVVKVHNPTNDQTLFTSKKAAKDAMLEALNSQLSALRSTEAR
jgi:hypothetical protein